VLGGPVEAILGPLKRQPPGPALLLGGQPAGQPDEEGGVGQHVGHRRAGGQGSQLDAQMATGGRVIHRPVPAPHRALVQPQLRQRRRLPRLHSLKWILVAQHRQQRLVQPHGLGEQRQRPLPQPAGPERHAGKPAAEPAAVTVVDGLLAQGDAGLFPQPVAKEGGRVAGHGQRRGGGQLDGVVGAGEGGRVDPQVDLEGGVGPLQDNVVAVQLQRIGAGDAQVEGVVA
jgi:hypothetical protein